jgi:predicted RNA-binding protein (virulence factor B family)
VATDNVHRSNSRPAAYEDLVGRFVKLTIRRFGSPGAFLALDPADLDPRASVVLLPGAEVPEGANVGDTLEVFASLDSEDRPIVTMVSPKLTLGDVAFLTVTDVTKFGAFVDWGLPKELLVPYALLTKDVRVGERHPIGLIRDDTGRLAGTMRVAEMLRDAGQFELDQWVSGEAWRNDPRIGVFVIVERKYVGLCPAHEPQRLSRGEAAKFRVASILPDGKIELSLRGHAHEEVEKDAANVLALLSGKAAPRVGDHSSPEDIRRLFGLSKKAFKRVIGHLLKKGRVTLDQEGYVVVR